MPPGEAGEGNRPILSQWWRESIAHHISSVVEHPQILNPGAVCHQENPTVWQPRKAQHVPPYFSRTKASCCQKKRTHLEPKRERLHCSPSLRLSSTTPSSCCAGLAARRGFFYFGFSAGGQSSLGCGIREDVAMFFPLAFSTLPSVPSGIARQRISSSMRNVSGLRAVEAARSRVIARRAEVRAGTQSHV